MPLGQLCFFYCFVFCQLHRLSLAPFVPVLELCILIIHKFTSHAAVFKL